MPEQLGFSPEEEKKEPTLEEWANAYAIIEGGNPAEILDALQSFQSEMDESDKQELTMPIYSKKGLTTSETFKMIEKKNPWGNYISLNGLTPVDADCQPISETDKATVAFTRFNQEPDEDSIGKNAKSAEEWEKTDKRFISPKLMILAGMAYQRLTRKQMNDDNWTMFPGFRMLENAIPRLRFFQSTGVQLSFDVPKHNDPWNGVRRIASKELE
jgi:hypothetical protein